MAFGAAGLMRMPTRLNITWEKPNTLKIDTDAGQQTRRLVFDKSVTPPTTRSLQGFSVAEWERPAAGRGGVAVAAVVAAVAEDRVERLLLRPEGGAPPAAAPAAPAPRRLPARASAI